MERQNLAVALQTPLGGETPYESAARLGSRAAQVQAYNWSGATDTTWGTLAYFDRGELDFPRYLRILRKQRVDGWVSIDQPNHHPWEATAAHEIAYLRRLFAVAFW